jgi:hypothetical protein
MDLLPGADLVIDCDGVAIADDPSARRVGDAFAAEYEWRFAVRGGAADVECLRSA